GDGVGDAANAASPSEAGSAGGAFEESSPISGPGTPNAGTGGAILIGEGAGDNAGGDAKDGVSSGKGGADEGDENPGLIGSSVIGDCAGSGASVGIGVNGSMEKGVAAAGDGALDGIETAGGISKTFGSGFGSGAGSILGSDSLFVSDGGISP